MSFRSTKGRVFKRKLVVVGDGACGKTSLLVTFSKDSFPTMYVPTVFENYVADMTLGNKEVRTFGCRSDIGQSLTMLS